MELFPKHLSLCNVSVNTKRDLSSPVQFGPSLCHATLRSELGLVQFCTSPWVHYQVELPSNGRQTPGDLSLQFIVHYYLIIYVCVVTRFRSENVFYFLMF